ncbi:hypothetical protein LTR10_006286 [Elasticomyces elasticus]|nr:hypothetical protein LTR10_006286 [Elasticomyces elasticus]KAK4966664.1 hypothetical protein LTR42_010975 [Elasticomyces elasticus]
MISPAVRTELLINVKRDKDDLNRTAFAKIAILALQDSTPEDDEKPVPPFTCPGYPFESKAPTPTCPESCTICTKQYFQHTYLEHRSWRRLLDMHSDAQAAAATCGFVESAKKDLAIVRQKISTHGDVLQKRWVRRSDKERAKFVLNAMPEACLDNFAWARMQNELARNFNAFLHDCGSKSMGRVEAAEKLQELSSAYEHRSRKMYLLPYCDAQTLSEGPMALLGLLHHRANSDAAAWVTFDMEQTKLAFEGLIACPSYSPHAVVMYGPHFGRLIPWNKQSAHQQDIIGYPRAVIILEAQCVLARFLRTIVDLILENGMDAALPGRSQWDALVASEFHATSGPLSRRLDAFNAPPQYDIEAIVRVLEERHKAMLDEIEGLQTDPLYFRNHIQRVRDSAYDQTQKDDARDIFIVCLTLGYIWWADLLKMALINARFVRGVQKQYEGEIHVGKALPLRYACALLTLEKALTDLFEGQLMDLTQLLNTSKTFDDYYSSERKLTAQTREEMLRTHPLLWNVVQLSRKQETSPRYRWYLSFVDYLMARGTEKGQVTVDDQLALHFSNMMIVDDILAAIRSHRPRPDVAKDNETLLQWTKARGNSSGRKQTGFWLWKGTREWPSLKPIFDLPQPSDKLSRTAMTQHKDIRRAVEQFWDSLGDMLESDFPPTAECPEIMVRYTHTQKYKDDVENEYRRFEQAVTAKEETQTRRAQESTKPYGDAPLPLLFQGTDWPASPKPRVEIKVKSKTRKTADDSTTFGEADDSRRAIDSPTSRLTLQVKRRTKDIFDQMYPAPGAHLSDISWEDFVAAMVDAGCSVEPSRGSAFSFKDMKNSRGSMTFHRRHPVSTVDPIMLKNIGSRLQKWFEWDAETFVDRSSGTDE